MALHLELRQSIECDLQKDTTYKRQSLPFTNDSIAAGNIAK